MGRFKNKSLLIGGQVFNFKYQATIIIFLKSVQFVYYYIECI